MSAACRPARWWHRRRTRRRLRPRPVTADTTITLVAPMPWGAPASVLVDSETMTVTGVDPTGTKLTVTRGSAPAAHAAGAAVMGQVGLLFSAVTATGHAVDDYGDPAAGRHHARAHVHHDADTTTTDHYYDAPHRLDDCTAPPAAAAPANGIPAFLQIDGELMAVTQVDSTGTVVTVAARPSGAAATL